MSTSILLADDSPTIAKILRMALQSEPYEIRSVLTADDAVKELQTNPPYFFLVDLMLPQRDGYEFARWIRNDPKLKNIRIVLLSSAFEPVDQARFEVCGADALIEKPFDPSDLRLKLKQIVEKPPKFPPGTHVSGALSGSLVDTFNPAQIQKRDDLGIQELRDSPQFSNTDANGILSQFETPLANLPPLKGAEISKSIILEIENTNTETKSEVHENILDLGSVEESGAKTTMLDLDQTDLSKPNMVAPMEKFSIPIEGQPKSGQRSTPTFGAPEPLSPNAEALAAFFAAEIAANPTITKSNTAVAPPPSYELTPSMDSSEDSSLLKPDPQPAGKPKTAPSDAYDASIDALDWGMEANNDSLAGWSNTRKSEKTRRTNSQVAQMGMGATFDTGGSSFRFSDNYIQRITKSFSGDLHETVPSTPNFPHAENPAPEKHATLNLSGESLASHGDTDIFYAPPTKQAKNQHSASGHSSVPSSGPAATAGSAGNGAFASPQTVQLTAREKGMIEELVRKEVHTQVKEIIEKVAWEVIPELAENLIKTELEKVLKELEQ